MDGTILNKKYRLAERVAALEENEPEPYELPVASANTLGGVKIGEGLEINAETGVLSASDSGSSADYSTTERKIGKWFGQDLYERTYQLIENGTAKYEIGGLENKSFLVGLTGVGVAFISNFVGVRSAAIDSMPIANTSYYTYDKVNGGIFVATSFTFTDLFVTVRYTKATPATRSKKN